MHQDAFRTGAPQRPWRCGSGSNPPTNFISKHLSFIDLVLGNLLNRKIFISDLKVNVQQFLYETKIIDDRCLRMRYDQIYQSQLSDSP